MILLKNNTRTLLGGHVLSTDIAANSITIGNVTINFDEDLREEHVESILTIYSLGAADKQNQIAEVVKVFTGLIQPIEIVGFRLPKG